MDIQFTKLPKPLRLKGVSYDKLEDSKFLKITDLLTVNKSLEYEVTYYDFSTRQYKSVKHNVVDKEAIVFYSGADDISTRSLSNGLYVLRSCDTSRAYVKTPDGTIYLTNPYYIWDTWLRQDNPTLDNIDTDQIYAKGFIKGKLVTITHLHISKQKS